MVAGRMREGVLERRNGQRTETECNNPKSGCPAFAFRAVRGFIIFRKELPEFRMIENV
jgi:hypothetical protein